MPKFSTLVKGAEYITSRVSSSDRILREIGQIWCLFNDTTI